MPILLRCPLTGTGHPLSPCHYTVCYRMFDVNVRGVRVVVVVVTVIVIVIDLVVVVILFATIRARAAIKRGASV